MRNWEKFVRKRIDITEIVSGTARGIDRMGERYAKENNIPIKRFPAECITFWNKQSKGTAHMIDIGKKECEFNHTFTVNDV